MAIGGRRSASLVSSRGEASLKDHFPAARAIVSPGRQAAVNPTPPERLTLYVRSTPDVPKLSASKALTRSGSVRTPIFRIIVPR